MRTKQNNPILSRLLGLSMLVVTCWVTCSAWSLYGAMPKELRKSIEPFNPAGPGLFSSTKAIDTYFETNGVPAQIKEVRTKSEKFCFVWAWPYSGIDTTHLYCYGDCSAGWTLYLEATLRRTPNNADMEFRANGDYVDVIREGDVILKIKRPPDKPVVHPKR